MAVFEVVVALLLGGLVLAALARRFGAPYPARGPCRWYSSIEHLHATPASELLRDKTGPFVFMDTYVCVNSPEGIELVNPGQPSLKGRNLMHLKDLRGHAVVRDQIELAMKEGSGWLECYWYRPGTNLPARKETWPTTTRSPG